MELLKMALPARWKWAEASSWVMGIAPIAMASYSGDSTRAYPRQVKTHTWSHASCSGTSGVPHTVHWEYWVAEDWCLYWNQSNGWTYPSQGPVSLAAPLCLFSFQVWCRRAMD
jgi:hypothetical protein